MCVPVNVRGHVNSGLPPKLFVFSQATVPLGRRTSDTNWSVPEVAIGRTRIRSPEVPVNVKQSSSAATAIVPVVGAAPKLSAVQPTGLFARWIASE